MVLRIKQIIQEKIGYAGNGAKSYCKVAHSNLSTKSLQTTTPNLRLGQTGAVLFHSTIFKTQPAGCGKTKSAEKSLSPL